MTRLMYNEILINNLSLAYLNHMKVLIQRPTKTSHASYK